VADGYIISSLIFDLIGHKWNIAGTCTGLYMPYSVRSRTEGLYCNFSANKEK